VAKKKKEPSQPFEPTRLHIIAGLLVIAVFAGLAIALVTYFGGSSLSKSPQHFDVPQPAGPVPALDRSAAADLLGGKSFSDMTQDELDLVKREVQRVYDNSQFRSTSAFTPLGIDVFRIDGVTRAVRQYQVAATPGGVNDLVESVYFYCDDPSGKINVYHYAKSDFGAKATTQQLPHNQLPFDAIMSGVDWSQPTDLGHKTMEGRRVHGVSLQYTIPSTGKAFPADYWFDEENARLIARKAILSEDDTSGNVLRPFDWRQPQPLAIPPGQPAAPCAEAVYARIPSARPPATATSAAGSTPAADATATP
jgi:hypothetical protein